jgi:hypothetical protein
MTYEEALLQLIHQNCDKCMRSINFQILSDDNKNKRCEECETALAIKALEKQIPKKLTKDEIGFCYCPVCKQEPLRSKYCWRCGQALDWSDEE